MEVLSERTSVLSQWRRSRSPCTAQYSSAIAKRTEEAVETLQTHVDCAMLVSTEFEPLSTDNLRHQPGRPDIAMKCGRDIHFSISYIV